MLCARFLRPLRHAAHAPDRGFWGWVTRRYIGILGWSLGGRGGWRRVGPLPVLWLPGGWHRGLVVLTALAVFCTTPVLAVLVGTDFVPKDDQSEFEVTVTLRGA